MKKISGRGANYVSAILLFKRLLFLTIFMGCSPSGQSGDNGDSPTQRVNDSGETARLAPFSEDFQTVYDLVKGYVDSNHFSEDLTGESTESFGVLQFSFDASQQAAQIRLFECSEYACLDDLGGRGNELLVTPALTFFSTELRQVEDGEYTAVAGELVWFSFTDDSEAEFSVTGYSIPKSVTPAIVFFESAGEPTASIVATHRPLD